MTWTPESGCIGKQSYLDKHQAKAMSRSVSSRNRRYCRPDTHVYRCPPPCEGGCGLYHVGYPIGVRSQEDHAA